MCAREFSNSLGSRTARHCQRDRHVSGAVVCQHPHKVRGALRSLHHQVHLGSARPAVVESCDGRVMRSGVPFDALVCRIAQVGHARVG